MMCHLPPLASLATGVCSLRSQCSMRHVTHCGACAWAPCAQALRPESPCGTKTNTKQTTPTNDNRCSPVVRSLRSLRSLRVSARYARSVPMRHVTHCGACAWAQCAQALRPESPCGLCNPHPTHPLPCGLPVSRVKVGWLYRYLFAWAF